MIELICKCGFERVFHGNPPKKGTDDYVCHKCGSKMKKREES